MRLVSLAAEKIRLAAADEDRAQDLFAAVESENNEADGDGGLLHVLIERPAVVEEELEVLTPAEWQWFATWRQALGGGLDQTVLNYLTDCATRRFARYQVRALVLRDPETNDAAPRGMELLEAVRQEQSSEEVRAEHPPVRAEDLPEAVRQSVGLMWLWEQAHGARVTRMLGAQSARAEAAQAAGARVEEPIDKSAALIEEALELMADALQCATDASDFLIRELEEAGGAPTEAVRAYREGVANKRSITSEITDPWYQEVAYPVEG